MQTKITKISFTASEFGRMILQQVDNTSGVHTRTIGKKLDPTVAQEGQCFAVLPEHRWIPADHEMPGHYEQVDVVYKIRVVEAHGVLCTDMMELGRERTHHFTCVIDLINGEMSGAWELAKQLMLRHEWYKAPPYAEEKFKQYRCCT